MSIMRAKKLKADVAISAVFSLFSMIVLLWIVRLASEAYSPAMLGWFLLARRFAGAGANLFQLGASQTLRRYISINFDLNEEKLSYIYVALLGWLVISAIILVITFQLQFALEAWLFPGNPDALGLAIGTTTYALALVLNYIVFSSLIAERKIALGNFLDTLASGGFLIPLLLFYGGKASLPWLLQFHAFAVVLLSWGVAIWYVLSLHISLVPDLNLVKRAAGNFCRYGVPRTFVTFADMLILLIGPWLLRTNPEESGYLLIALTLTRAIQAAIQPLTQIASVVTARLIGSDNNTTLSEGINLLLGIVVYASTLLVAILVPWRYKLLLLWLGNAKVISGVLFYFDALIWAIIPYAVFQGLKGVIEMRWVRPLNLYTLVVSSVIYLLSYVILLRFVGPSDAVRCSTLLSFIVLGVGSLIACCSYLRHPRYWGVYRLCFAAAGLVVVNKVAANNLGGFYFSMAMSVSVVILWILVFLKPAPFVRDLREFLLPGLGLRKSTLQ
ncbi:hypothetical protein C4565_03580 [Candidatus Parcubacteria bacterium]|jgi:hypothetical protein|nr:MAG: hypothetical protein C4565_03580 [Candidatus Parcubacteria bacterium]